MVAASIRYSRQSALSSRAPSAKRALVRAAYLAQHEAVRWPLIALNRLLFGVLLGKERLHVSPAELSRVVSAVRHRYRELQRQDLAHAERGVYPVSQLFAAPIGDYARAMPALALDVVKVVRRARSLQYDDLPDEPELQQLPAYYRRCFHWQTDGYLSEHSASLYDLGVEILFTGMADVMRRQVLGELALAPSQRMLDVGCGTGRLLEQVSAAQPRAQLYGLDLSKAYLRHAQGRLRGKNVELRQGNAEQLPYPDASFDAVASAFVFHELPARVRRRVFAELQRVLRPGGTLVLLDSAQLNDSPELAPLLEQFPKDLHEPFFAQYAGDPLEALFDSPRWSPLQSRPVFVAKLLAARKLGVA